MAALDSPTGVARAVAGSPTPAEGGAVAVERGRLVALKEFLKRDDLAPGGKLNALVSADILTLRCET